MRRRGVMRYVLSKTVVSAEGPLASSLGGEGSVDRIKPVLRRTCRVTPRPFVPPRPFNVRDGSYLCAATSVTTFHTYWTNG